MGEDGPEGGQAVWMGGGSLLNLNRNPILNLILNHFLFPFSCPLSTHDESRSRADP
jgi:hypothetical protein